VEAPLDQVFDDLLLAVDGDAPAGQCAEINSVLLALKAQLDAVVDQAFASHSVADAGRAQEVGRSLFEHAGAHARLDVVPAAGAGRREVQPVAPAIRGVADAPDEATRGKPLQYLGGGGPIQRDALTQRPLVDILLGTQRVEYGELR